MLQIEKLSKKYKGKDQFAVQNISFSLMEGEIVGLIGKNGTGKTTIMKMIAKTIKPTSGTIKLNEEDIFQKDEMLKNVNFLIEPVFYTHINAYKNIKFYLTINQQKASYEKIKEVLTLVDLWEDRKRKPNEFSFGMKQRLGLAMCLASEPDVAVMDEPFTGLDPNGITALINRLKDWVKKNKISILVSSHQLNELEAISDRYLYIENGEIKKAFDKDSMKTTVIYLKSPIKQELLHREDVTQVDERRIKVTSAGESFNQLIASLSQTNTIIKMEKESGLKEIFKGG